MISTVSGGSIIGAFYYLHLKKLLETTPDEKIEDQHYIDTIKDIEKDFQKAVEINLRMMTYYDLKKNWQMRRPEYSRSDRIAELYDEYLYRPVANHGSKDMMRMKDLLILPNQWSGTEPKKFEPRKHNKQRKAKVPILLINATVLNNGHVWRFEASSMGESRIDNELSIDIDKNLRLRRPSSYSEMARPQDSIGLGHAVAASACVPGIFNPLAISGLYPDVRVQLVDGGVYDNQGIQGLIDAENSCNLLIVSDGSGQMDDEEHPNPWLAAALSRSDAILQKRLRGEQLSYVKKHFGESVAFCHLRQGLAPRIIPWINREGREVLEDNGCPIESECDRFGVANEVQELLSKIRTDLDSFSEIEAYSLMLDGYLTIGYKLSESQGFKDLPRSKCNPSTSPGANTWEFMQVTPWMAKADPQYLRHLAVAKNRFFKVFMLNGPLGAGTIALLALLLGWFIVKMPLADVEINLQSLLFTALFVGLGLLLPKLAKTFAILSFLQRPTRRLASLLGEAIIPMVAWVLVRFHLRFINPMFLRMGRLKTLSSRKNS